MSAPLPPRATPPACLNCGAWITEGYHCPACLAAAEGYKPRAFDSRKNSSLADSRNAEWHEELRREQRTHYDPGAPCPQCGGAGRHLSGCWLEKQDAKRAEKTSQY